MKYPLPIKSNNVIFVQAFRSNSEVDISKAYNKTTVEHLGVDLICGTPEETWGNECVWPFPFPGTVYDAGVDSPLGAKYRAHSQIDGTDPETGIQYSLIYIHLSAVTDEKRPDDGKTIIYKQGDVIGKIGNNGAVLPKPTPEKPYNGSHLHCGLGVKKPGDLNFLIVDPMTIFEMPSKFKFSKNLWFGMKNNDVKELQKRLGVFPATGYFGPLTLRKVIGYQAINGITPAIGFIGPITRNSLNK